MGQQSRSRQKRAQERQQPPAPAPAAPAQAPAAPAPREGPQRLIAEYGAAPIVGLPPPVDKFHLRIVGDILEGHEGCPPPAGALRATRVWHRHLDGFAASRPNQLNFGGVTKQLACASGCNHCCRSPVGVVAAEAVLVADHVARTFSAPARRELERRMAERRAALADKDPTRTFLLCPLNVDGKCSVYEVRPYNCRVFHSFDVGACERRFVAGDTQQALPIDPVRTQFDQLIVASASVAFTAMKFDMRMLELMPALELALAAGDERCERFAAGDDLFARLPTISPPWATPA